MCACVFWVFFHTWGCNSFTLQDPIINFFEAHWLIAEPSCDFVILAQYQQDPTVQKTLLYKVQQFYSLLRIQSHDSWMRLGPQYTTTELVGQGEKSKKNINIFYYNYYFCVLRAHVQWKTSTTSNNCVTESFHGQVVKSVDSKTRERGFKSPKQRIFSSNENVFLLFFLLLTWKFVRSRSSIIYSSTYSF